MIEIHIDQWNNHFIWAGIRPVALKLFPFHDLNNRFWIVNLCILQQISVIPAFYFIKIHMVFRTEPGYLWLGKTCIISENLRIQHCELIKIIKCWLRFHLFDWQNPGKIRELNVFGRLRSLKKSTQKIDIFFLHLFVGGLITDQNIPFIHDYNEFFPCCRINAG